MAVCGWTRRRLLATAAATLLTPDSLGFAQGAQPRIVSLDWGMTSTLISLGIRPVGAAEQSGYRDWAREPAIPAGVVEVGLRTAPSFEALAALRPDLIITSPANASIGPQLERIAPTFCSTVYTAERAPLARNKAITRALGERLGCTERAQALVEGSEARIEQIRQRLAASGRAGAGRPPLLPLNILDAHHLCFYGKGSLYNDVLDAVGLRNGFTGETGSWGSTVAGVEALAACPRTDVLLIEPVAPESRAMLEAPGLWSSLLQQKGARQIRLPPVWAFGDLGSAVRFAELLDERLPLPGTEEKAGLPGRWGRPPA